MKALHVDWQHIAWQGISFLVPSDWHVVQLHIAQNEGYMRMDDSEMVRLELRWLVMPIGRAINLREQAETYLSRISKELKKRGKSLKQSIDTKLVGRHQVKGRDVVTFSWANDYIGEGMIWWCEKCNKLLMVQVIGSRGEKLREVARKVFVNISDHSSDEWHEWVLFGLNFKVHSSMRLCGHKVESGFVRLHFKRGDEESLEVARWSAANLILKGTTLDRWAAQALKEHLRRFEIVYRHAKFMGHDCIELDGKAKMPFGSLQLLVRQLAGRTPMPKLRGTIWRCDETNRLFMVLVTAPAHTIDGLLSTATSFRCH